MTALTRLLQALRKPNHSQEPQLVFLGPPRSGKSAPRLPRPDDAS